MLSPFDPGVNSCSKHYSKSKLITVLKQLEQTLLDSRVLAMEALFSKEIANSIKVDSESLQTIQFFSISSSTTLVKSKITNETFFYFVQQLCYIQHILAGPLFKIATQFQDLSIHEVDLLLSQF